MRERANERIGESESKKLPGRGDDNLVKTMVKQDRHVSWVYPPDSSSVPLRVMVQTSGRKHYFLFNHSTLGSILLSNFYSLLS